MEFKELSFEQTQIRIIDGDRGKNYPKKSDLRQRGHTLFLNNKNIINNYLDDSFGEYISEEKSNLLRKGKLERGDLVISTRGSIGNVGYYSSDIRTENIRINSGMLIIRNFDNSIDTEYLYVLMRSNFMKQRYKERISGSVQNQLPIRDFKKIKIPIPDLHSQIIIKNVILTLDSKIEINNKIISNLESQAQAIFKSWFVDFEPFQDGNFVESELGMIPEGWEVKELGEVADFSNGYSFKSKDLLEEKKSKNDYKVFKQADIKVGGGINPNNTKSWIDSEFIRKNKLSRFIIQSGDLLMCMTDMKNNVRLLGNTALVYQPDEYILNQRVGRLRSKQKEIKPSFLYYLTNNSVFLNDLRGRANTGVQVNLSTSEIKRSKVILPTCNIIKRFCDYSESITKSINSLNNQNTKLAELRDALLPKLMAGEIDVSNIKIEGEEVKNE